MAAPFPEATLQKIRRLGYSLNLLARFSPTLAGRAAFRIFCTPRRLPLRPNDREFLATAEASNLETADLLVRVYTWKAGDAAARTVLFLHGWESNSARWRKYIKALHEAGFTVQAFDAPANGNSGGRMLNVLLYSRVVKAFMEQFGAPYAVVGHSLGGAAAVMSMALLNASRSQKLVLMGVFAESSRVIRDFGEILGVQPVVLAGVYREIERLSGIPIHEYSVEKKVALLSDVEGLVLHDRDDEVAPVTEGRAIAAAWPARYLETTGLGHRMQDASVVKAVLEFLRS